MLRMVVVGTNLMVAALLVIGLLFMSYKKKSPCAIVYFGGMTLGMCLMLRVIGLSLVPSQQHLLLFVIFLWLVVALVLVVVDYVICGNDL